MRILFYHHSIPVSLMKVKLTGYIYGPLNHTCRCWPEFGSSNLPPYRGSDVQVKVQYLDLIYKLHIQTLFLYCSTPVSLMKVFMDVGRSLEAAI